MTVYALRLENATDTAGRVRMGDLLGLTPNSNLGARGGIRPGPTAADVAVTAGTMNVTVQPFLAWVDGGVGDTQGGYPFVSDAVVTLTLADGHGSLSRTDVVCAVVRDDPYDSSGSVAASVEVVAGTPGAGTPTLPTNCVPLRNIVVPAGASTGTGGLSSGALSTDRRTYTSGLGGVINVGSQAERDALPAVRGLAVFRLDLDRLQVRTSTGWLDATPGAAAWTAYTPAWGSTGSILGNGTLTGAFEQINNTIHFRAQLTIGSTTSVSPSTQTLTLPAPAKAGTYPVFHGEAFDVSVGGSVRVHTTPADVSTAVLLIPPTEAGGFDRTLGTSAPFTWGAGDRITIAGTYERA